MKKILFGFIIGLAIAIPVGAHAEVTNLINQLVQGMFPVTIDGKPLGNAIAVDNKTYLPVREFGEATGYTVTFTADQQVVLTKNVVATQPTTAPSTTPTTGVNTLVKAYNDLGTTLNKVVDDKQALEKQINDIGIKRLETNNADYMKQDEIDLKKQVDAKQVEIDKMMTDRKNLEAQMKVQP